MYKKIAFFLTITLFSLVALAQSPASSIRGIVRDSLTRQPLEDATITLIHLPDSTVQRRIRSTKKEFVFTNLTPGSYQLVTTYLGYATDVLRFQLDTTAAAKTFAIDLKHSASALMEVVVHAAIPPAIVKNDTIAFNAGAYPTRPNATVEDLLRKLPGIDIDKNGNVTMQGQKVDKIYLDGKEFFLNDPRTATQNLPADIVDQIEAFDSQSERARLTGVREPTGSRTLNIKLKKDRKKGYFGRAYAGTGSGGGDGKGGVTSSYSAGGTATSLGSNWIFGTANLNNMNNQFTGKDNKNGPGSGGLQTFNDAQLNFKTDKSSKLNLTLNAGTNGVRTELQTATQRKTLLTDSSLYENRFSNSKSKNQSYHANAFLEYNIDSFSVINLRSVYTPQTSSSDAQDTVGIQTQKNGPAWTSNQGHTNNSNHSDGYNINNNLNFRRRWRLPGRTLFLSLTQSHDHQDQPSTLYSLVNYFDSTGNTLQRKETNLVSDQQSNADSYSASISYTEPIKPGHLLDFTYRLNHSISKSDKQSYDYDSASGKYDIPDSLTTNHFINYNTIHRFSTGYNATDGKYRYQLGLTFQVSDLDDHNLTANTDIKQHQLNWYPRASLIYTPKKGTTVNIQYTANTVSPTIQQLQPLPDLTNPFLVRIGNPDLLQQLTHTFSANYTGFNSRSFRNLQIGVQGDVAQHQITPATTVLAGGIQQIQYINVDGVWHVSSNITYGFPLGDQRKGNSSFGMHIRYGRDVSRVNGEENVTTGVGWGSNLKLNFHPVEKLFIEANASVDYTGSLYSIYANQNTKLWQQNYSIDASYELPGAITLASNYNISVTGSQGALPSKAISLWNASVYKDFLRDRSAQIRFSAFGILNTVSNYTQTQGLNYIETRQANMPGRILLLSFIYRFRHFPGARPRTSS
ncbi:MAG: TonB-dependent receptor [Bacteroidetes bacterium]|nr:TonB-dependent receptor [Bacteroidota bacterium]